MKIPQRLRSFVRPGGTWTLEWVAVLSFLGTGALLLGWDLIEHAFLSAMSSVSVHRMHIVRGISTGVLVAVGIAALLLRNQRRHEQHMKALQRRLIRQERMAAVGELAGGIAHELLNPLAGIAGALTIVAREIPLDDENRETMEEIQQQVRRMERLVGELRAYARPGQLRAEWIDLHSILAQAAASVRQLPRETEADLILDLDPRIPEIYADPREFEHSFENLIRNAYQAVGHGGKIEVRTQLVGQHVHVSVSDNGVGIEADLLGKIFEPFFTTKDGATGLGLSLVRRAIENQGGDISVRSAPGQGTAFDLVLSTSHGPSE